MAWKDTFRTKVLPLSLTTKPTAKPVALSQRDTIKLVQLFSLTIHVDLLMSPGITQVGGPEGGPTYTEHWLSCSVPWVRGIPEWEGNIVSLYLWEPCEHVTGTLLMHPCSVLDPQALCILWQYLFSACSPSQRGMGWRWGSQLWQPLTAVCRVAELSFIMA